MIPEHELKAEQVHEMLLKRLKTHLSLKTEGWRCTSEQTLNSLIKGVAEGSSVEAVCADAEAMVDGNTLREPLNAGLDGVQLRQPEAAMNAALCARGGLEVALDTHAEPFYGKTPELLTYTCAGRAQDGTSHFFRRASAYVMWREVRLTLALT